jgi:hypothetical protein
LSPKCTVRRLLIVKTTPMKKQQFGLQETLEQKMAL